MKQIIFLSLLLVQYYIANAGYGYNNNCGVAVEINNKSYILGDCNTGTNEFFNAKNFGHISALTINKLQQLTYENGTDNVTAATMYYRIYNGNAPSFNSVNLTTITTILNGEEKREALPGLDLMLGLQMNTTYTFEIYFKSQLSNGTTFEYNNNTANFKATFTTPNILPIKMASFTVNTQNNLNQIKWATSSEFDMQNFTILRSNNGNNWTEIGIVNAANLANGSSYSFYDNNPLKGNNFYRIISNNRNGEKTFSVVIRNFFGRIDNSLSLYPNPTVDYLKVNFVSNIRGQYILDMYNDAGQRLHQQTFNHNGSDKTISIDLPKSMKKGPYRIFISNSTDFFIGTFIVQ